MPEAERLQAVELVQEQSQVQAPELVRVPGLEPVTVPHRAQVRQ